MRVRCNICGSKATIQTASDITDDVRHLYCTCNNVRCGHTFVANLEFSHTLSPSALSLPKKTRERIKDMPHHQQRDMFSYLDSPGLNEKTPV